MRRLVISSFEAFCLLYRYVVILCLLSMSTMVVFGQVTLKDIITGKADDAQ